MIRKNSGEDIIKYADPWLICIYIVLVVMGWLSIYSVTGGGEGGFSFTGRYGMQLIWMIVSFVLGATLLLLDSRYYHIMSYPFYTLMMIVLLGVVFLGKEVKGARSWIALGPIAFQPAELAKFAVSLALARYMSNYTFNIRRLKDLGTVAFIIALPMLIILLQNDTGSALVFGGFLFMLYREGLNRWIYIVLALLISLFIASFFFEPYFIIWLVFLIAVFTELIHSRNWPATVVYLALFTVVYLFASLLIPYYYPGVALEVPLIVAMLLTLPLVLIYAYRYAVRKVLGYIFFVVGSVCVVLSVDYVFENVMQVHQQKRVLDLLGIESDVRGWGYNVNQSKIAIGSGGFSGKGFLEGTQTKYNFVPEQSTDFIFCTVGEEFGFIGSAAVVILFMLLILRLMRIGDRQNDAFSRIYCYCVASVFFFHMVINIGMTIGIVPVIGIPLPFFSYGGSSLMAFTLLLFVAIRLDMDRHYRH